MKSRLSFTILIPIARTVVAALLLCLNVLFFAGKGAFYINFFWGSQLAGDAGYLITSGLLVILNFSLIWLELLQKIISVTIDGNTLIVKSLLQTKRLDLTNCTCSVEYLFSRFGAHNELLVIRCGKYKANISQFYIKNYQDLTGEVKRKTTCV